MRYSELTRKLSRLGVELYREGKGAHEIWWWPERSLKTTIPRHTSREIAAGTLAKMLRDLGLTQDDIAGL